jgi:hypothetical protein
MERPERRPARPEVRGAQPPPERGLGSTDLGPINVLLQTRTVCPKCAQNVPKMCPRVTTIIPCSNHVRTMFGPCSDQLAFGMRGRAVLLEEVQTARARGVLQARARWGGV